LARGRHNLKTTSLARKRTHNHTHESMAHKRTLKFTHYMQPPYAKKKLRKMCTSDPSVIMHESAQAQPRGRANADNTLRRASAPNEHEARKGTKQDERASPQVHQEQSTSTN
jgi:hypothetical protein